MKFSEEGEVVNIEILNEEDLWYLSLVLKPGDHLISEVLRRVERSTDVVRMKKTEREKIKVNIKIENVEFMEFSYRLHILGQIDSWPEDLVGEHQSVNVGKGSMLRIVPQDFVSFTESLQESTNFNTSSVLVLSIDDRNISLFKVNESRNEMLWKISTATGKMYDSKENRYVDEFLKMMEPSKGSEIYLIGPSIFRDSLSKLLIQSKFSIINTQIGGSEEEGIRELLQEGTVNLRRSSESKLVSDFLKGINSGMSLYGKKQVDRSLDMRAVSVLLISDKFFRDRSSQQYMEKCSQGGCRIFIAHSSWETGKIVESYGGVVALLRFKILNELSA